MIQTRATLIVEKYNTLQKELESILGKKDTDAALFPSLDDIDLSDLVYFVTITFVGLETEEQFRKEITSLVSCHGFSVTDKQMEKLVPKILLFVIWLRDL